MDRQGMKHYTIICLWTQSNRSYYVIALKITNHLFFNWLLVGGIYTVIRSKAFVSTEEMGEQYILLGPYKERSARTEVEEMDFPSGSPLNIAINKMRELGFKVH